MEISVFLLACCNKWDGGWDNGDDDGGCGDEDDIAKKMVERWLSCWDGGDCGVDDHLNDYDSGGDDSGQEDSDGGVCGDDDWSLKSGDGRDGEVDDDGEDENACGRGDDGDHGKHLNMIMIIGMMMDTLV